MNFSICYNILRVSISKAAGFDLGPHPEVEEVAQNGRNHKDSGNHGQL